MKKHILHPCLLAALLVGGLSSCDDTDDVKDLVLDRVLSPTNLEARLNNNVNIALSWDDMSGADYYEIEAFADNEEYSGTADVAQTSTAAKDTLKGLLGETTYYIRIRAIDEDDSSRDSKWSTISTSTGAEQNMKSASDVGSSSVTLTWEAGIEVDAIIIAPSEEGSEAVTVTYELSADEIEAGTAYIEGLTPETSYTATLKLGDKTRGTATFTTAIDLGGATAFYADATEDEIKELFANLTAGETVCFLPSDASSVVGDVSSPIEISLTVPCTITGIASQPVTAGLSFKIATEEAGDLVISNLNFAGTSSTVCLEVDQMATGSNVTITGCTIDTYKNILTETSAAETSMGTLTIDNCVISSIAARGVDFQKKLINFAEVNFQNNTVYNSCSGSDLLRFDYVAGRVGAVYNVTNNTIYDVKATSKGLIYIRSNSAGNQDFTCNVTKNIFAFSTEATTVAFSEDSKTDNVVFSDNYYYNATSLTTSGKVYDTTGKTLTEDPFTDAANGDFTLTNEDLSYYKIGDPRWY